MADVNCIVCCEHRASKILRGRAGERSHQLDQDLQDRGRELTRLPVGNFSGRSNGEPKQILGSALPQVPKNSDPPTVVIRRILLIWSRLSLYVPLHPPVFPLTECSLRKKVEKVLAYSVLVSYNTIEPATPSIADLFVAVMGNQPEWQKGAARCIRRLTPSRSLSSNRGESRLRFYARRGPYTGRYAANCGRTAPSISLRWRPPVSGCWPS